MNPKMKLAPGESQEQLVLGSIVPFTNRVCLGCIDYRRGILFTFFLYCFVQLGLLIWIGVEMLPKRRSLAILYLGVTVGVIGNTVYAWYHAARTHPRSFHRAVLGSLAGFCFQSILLIGITRAVLPGMYQFLGSLMFFVLWYHYDRQIRLVALEKHFKRNNQAQEAASPA
jgi:uncharacterized membrane protein